ncbi:mechanosensitive ion channel family protein [Mariniphaga sediminis]|jgi:small conductance mechanosensitive channel|uniref:Mechanosensitive ion channel family protein n=1 Tax=Mariniphaga sediminis TaxID=1628158 RepID=A0A399CWT6_9BACT|nr:mechanosensitive ion channel domain-containing protein [Mariniphaga sediminis]RIH63686.1 mechanosensitive ion channel family protein [Mariniphaga sediminis]
MESIDTLWQKVYDVVFTLGPRLVGAIITLIIGWWIIKIIQKSIRRSFEKREMEPSLRGFLNSMIGILLKTLLLISVVGMLGVQMTSFIAILGAAGLAVGMALSGTLQNFAGGVIILLFKPFKAGDYIEAQGHSGSVNEIQIFNTILKTPDNKTIIIPNGGLSTGSMINYSTEPRRRVDFVFGIGYGDDVDKAKTVLKKLIDGDDRILKDPEPFIAVSALADSSVNLVVRVWAEAANYWGIYFDMHEKVYKTFDKEGLNIPFPQMDVHVHK